ncbi:MAG: 16S rRNA (uracil(1498)-N(3))-methyltransferase, partial [Ignavibacteriales bacterium]|nr:16S rRNA (uracil(1498)-N(3))-methyltransferase [Ignavibacteriales bacterium]
MEYFYVDHSDVHGNTLLIRGEEHKHLVRVLRKQAGDRVLVTDGNDAMFDAVIVGIERDGVRCEISNTMMRYNEPRIDVTLAISLLKNPSRFDVVVEKGTELGVRRIIPMMCERTIPRHDKHDRFEKITLAAMKQCGRSYRPRIFPLTPFEEMALHAGEYPLRLIPHEKTEQSQFVGSVVRHHPEVKSVLVMIGPEGGFTDHEIETASRNKFIPISLGPRRLRSETAALTALTHVMG